MEKSAKKGSAKKFEKDATASAGNTAAAAAAAGDQDKKEAAKKNENKKDAGKKSGKKKKRSSDLSKVERLDESIDEMPPQQFEWEGFEEEAEPKIRPILSCNSLIIQDYREFKAARTIQTRLRGWFTRHMLAKRRRAAIIIQTAWRAFYARRYYYRFLENKLQQRILEHFNRQATKIQALWRGFYVRENIHDQRRLTGIQITAAEDLLYCVAFKLHHLLRTHQIPGVYSLKNSACFSKIEKLLASMNFKDHNNRARLARVRYENNIRQAKKKHENSAFRTRIPYPGPNFASICEPRCAGLFKERDADKKMYRILKVYEEAIEEEGKRKKKSSHKKSDKIKKMKIPDIPFGDFCGDIVKSMNRWRIIDKEKLTVDKDVFKTPENVENFLHEIQSKLSVINPRCHCYMKASDMRDCVQK